MAMQIFDVWTWAQAPLGIGSVWLFVSALRRVLDALAAATRSARVLMFEFYLFIIEARALVALQLGRRRTGAKRGAK